MQFLITNLAIFPVYTQTFSLNVFSLTCVQNIGLGYCLCNTIPVFISLIAFLQHSSAIHTYIQTYIYTQNRTCMYTYIQAYIDTAYIHSYMYIHTWIQTCI